MFGESCGIIGKQGAGGFLETRQVTGQRRHDAIGCIARGAAFAGARPARRIDQPAQRDGGAARLRRQPVPMARQQRDLARGHPQFRAPTRRWPADAGACQHVGDAAARIHIDNGAGGMAKHQQRPCGTSCFGSVQGRGDIGETAGGDAAVAIEGAMGIIGHRGIYPGKIMLVNITRMKYRNNMSIDRKAAIASYRERKAAPGIFAIRCAASGQQWLGQAPDITTVQARHWFGLRLGSHANRAMQAAWNAHGAADFSFESLELLPEEDNPVTLSSQLRDALKRWRGELGAPAV